MGICFRQLSQRSTNLFKPDISALGSLFISSTILIVHNLPQVLKLPEHKSSNTCLAASSFPRLSKTFTWPSAKRGLKTFASLALEYNCSKTVAAFYHSSLEWLSYISHLIFWTFYNSKFLQKPCINLIHIHGRCYLPSLFFHRRLLKWSLITNVSSHWLT